MFPLKLLRSSLLARRDSAYQCVAGFSVPPASPCHSLSPLLRAAPESVKLVSVCCCHPDTPGLNYCAKFTLRLSGDGLLLTGTVEPISEVQKKKSLPAFTAADREENAFKRLYWALSDENNPIWNFLYIIILISFPDCSNIWSFAVYWFLLLPSLFCNLWSNFAISKGRPITFLHVSFVNCNKKK